MAEEALVAALSFILPVPELESCREPLLFTVIVPIALLVEIVPEFVSVPPLIVKEKAEELLVPDGAVAEMVPEFVNVPLPIDKEMVELVPDEALVDNVPLLDTDADVLVKLILLPVVDRLPALLKLPLPMLMLRFWFD